MKKLHLSHWYVCDIKNKVGNMLCIILVCLFRKHMIFISNDLLNVMRFFQAIIQKHYVLTTAFMLTFFYKSCNIKKDPKIICFPRVPFLDLSEV